jgi:hypothetical protein
MRTVTLSFKGEQLQITGGIKVKDIPDKTKLELFSQEERVLVLPVDTEHPPLVMYPINGHVAGQLHLAMVSFIFSAEGLPLASLEIDTRESALVFIDAIDDICEHRNTGEYSLPLHHDERLPHGFIPTRYGPSQFGLVICAPRDTCVIRSTSGHLAKVQLDDNGKFFRVPCDVRDRALMDGRL